MEIQCAGLCSFGALNLLTADRQRIDGHIVALGVQVGRVELAGPGIITLPPCLLVTRVIEDNDIDRLAGSASALKVAHKTDFCEAVRERLEGHDELQHIDQVVRAVLRVLDHRIEPGQIAHVVDALPERARRLWHDAH